MLMSSPVNVIVSEAADDAGAGPFPFFSFALVGLPLLVGTVAICVVLGPRLLPARDPSTRRPTSAATPRRSRPTTTCATGSTGSGCGPAPR